ncbi:chromosome partitioning protein [Pseudoxanthomonas sp. GM95]|uniref:ParA family protein n=1 Tax=Pseudoxanthomonas sp. GM95 TaxID=1881043 RepID=UPI0008B8A1ED|nr:ParA family protein [Pseudoxanthomonas sp. GM95]SEK49392.1 chromosome partitioning protein [Pseudoxanthomonas sp. GM95]
MQIWAIANQKGGVGKTTSTLCLARGLAESGQRVLLIDLDPHASMTRAFNVPRHPVPSGTHELFSVGAPGLDTLARTTPIERLRLLAAQPGLATLERRSATQPGLGMALQRALAGVTQLYDYTLLDCPPTLGLLMVNALAAADCLVVPTQTDPLALHGLADMLRTAEMVETSRRRPLARFVLPTLFDKRTTLGAQSLELLHGLYAGRVWPDAVPMDARLRDARAIAANSPLSGAGADAYQQALDWLLAQPPATTPQSRAA